MRKMESINILTWGNEQMGRERIRHEATETNRNSLGLVVIYMPMIDISSLEPTQKPLDTSFYVQFAFCYGIITGTTDPTYIDYPTLQLLLPHLF